MVDNKKVMLDGSEGQEFSDFRTTEPLGFLYDTFVQEEQERRERVGDISEVLLEHEDILQEVSCRLEEFENYAYDTNRNDYIKDKLGADAVVLLKELYKDENLKRLIDSKLVIDSKLAKEKRNFVGQSKLPIGPKSGTFTSTATGLGAVKVISMIVDDILPKGKIDLSLEKDEYVAEAGRAASRIDTDGVILTGLSGRKEDSGILGVTLNQIMEGLDALDHIDRAVGVPNLETENGNKLVAKIVAIRQLMSKDDLNDVLRQVNIEPEKLALLTSLLFAEGNALHPNHNRVLYAAETYGQNLLLEDSQSNMRESKGETGLNRVVHYVSGVVGDEYMTLDGSTKEFEHFSAQLERYIASKCLVASVDALTEGMEKPMRDRYLQALYLYSKGEPVSEDNPYHASISVIAKQFEVMRNQYFGRIDTFNLNSIKRHFLPMEVIRPFSATFIKVYEMDEDVDPYSLLGIMFKAYQEVMPGWKERKVVEAVVNAFEGRTDIVKMSNAGKYLSGAFEYGSGSARLVESLEEVGRKVSNILESLQEEFLGQVGDGTDALKVKRLSDAVASIGGTVLQR